MEDSPISRVALCFFGQPRKVEFSYPFFKREILNVYDTDVFYHTWFSKNPENYRTSEWRKKEDCLFIKDPEIIRKLYKPKLFMVEEPKSFTACKYSEGYLRSTEKMIRNAESTLSQLYSRKTVRNLFLSWCQTHKKKYDLVIMVRFDFFLNTLDIGDPEKIYFGSKYDVRVDVDIQEYSDWIVIANQENFLKIFDIDADYMLHKGISSLYPEEFIARKIIEHNLTCDASSINGTDAYLKIAIFSNDPELSSHFEFLLKSLGFYIVFPEKLTRDEPFTCALFLSCFANVANSDIWYICVNFESVENRKYMDIFDELTDFTQKVLLIDFSFHGKKVEDQKEVYKPSLKRIALPYGYSYFYEKIGDTFGNPLENINVLFYGDLKDERIKKIFELLRGRNCVFVTNEVSLSEKYGLISRSKVVLSISTSYETQFKTNDLRRLSYLISNKKFVIAEKRGDFEIENKLKDVVDFFPVGDFSTLLTKVDYYLTHEVERKEKAILAYEKFRREFNFDFGFAKIMRDFRKVLARV